MPIGEIVSQISPPMRILLAGAVVFLAVWFTLLRPKSDDVTPVAATPTPATGNVNTGEPAVSGPGKIVEKAKSAVSKAEGQAAAAAGEATATATPAAGAKSATTTEPAAKAQALPAVPEKELAKLPKSVAKAVSGHKVLVLAVLSTDAKRWRPMADDDRYVRNTLKKVNRYDGGVLVKQVPLTSLASYGPIVNDLNVNQTPSVVVVDRKLQARVLEGYVDRITINQAVADARQDSIDPLITDSYLRKANEVCANGNLAASRWSLPTISGRKAWLKSGRRIKRVMRDYLHAIKTLPAPAKWRGLKRGWVAQTTADVARFDKVFAAAEAGKFDAAGALSAGYDGKAARKLDHRFDEAGLTSCSVLRRQ